MYMHKIFKLKRAKILDLPIAYNGHTSIIQLKQNKKKKKQEEHKTKTKKKNKTKQEHHKNLKK